jgi:hypothetical protein
MCPGDSATICAPAGYAGYQWNAGPNTACINATEAADYSVTVTDSRGCTATSNQVSVGFYTSSAVTVSVNGDTLAGYGYNSYQWLLNGVPLSGATSSVYVAHSYGSYTLQIVDANGCKSTSTPVVISGVADEVMDYTITVFPNPARTAWQLTVSPQLIGATAQVFDATGQLVFYSDIRQQTQDIGLANAATGIYELRIISNGFSVVRKLVKI